MSHASPKATAAFIAQAAGYTGEDCLLWPFGKTQGYGRIGRGYAHALVCEAAHGPKPVGHEVAHSCGVRSCVNQLHLRWDTPKGNQADQVRHNGGQHPNAKLTAAQVSAIRSHGGTNAATAAEYGVTKATVTHIRTKRNWSWL